VLARGSAIYSKKFLKGSSVEVSSKNGNITSSKLLQGNCTLAADGGNMHLKKLQGCKMALSACGDIQAQDVYADNLNIVSQSGNVKWGFYLLTRFTKE